MDKTISNREKMKLMSNIELASFIKSKPWAAYADTLWKNEQIGYVDAISIWLDNPYKEEDSLTLYTDTFWKNR